MKVVPFALSTSLQRQLQIQSAKMEKWGQRAVLFPFFLGEAGEYFWSPERSGMWLKDSFQTSQCCWGTCDFTGRSGSMDHGGHLWFLESWWNLLSEFQSEYEEQRSFSLRSDFRSLQQEEMTTAAWARGPCYVHTGHVTRLQEHAKCRLLHAHMFTLYQQGGTSSFSTVL